MLILIPFIQIFISINCPLILSSESIKLNQSLLGFLLQFLFFKVNRLSFIKLNILSKDFTTQAERLLSSFLPAWFFLRFTDIIAILMIIIILALFLSCTLVIILILIALVMMVLSFSILEFMSSGF